MEREYEFEGCRSVVYFFFFCNDHIFEVQFQDVGSSVIFESIGHV